MHRQLYVKLEKNIYLYGIPFTFIWMYLLKAVRFFNDAARNSLLPNISAVNKYILCDVNGIPYKNTISH